MSTDPDISKNVEALRQLIDYVTKQGQGIMVRLAEQTRQTLLQSAGTIRDLGERHMLEQAAACCRSTLRHWPSVIRGRCTKVFSPPCRTRPIRRGLRPRSSSTNWS